MNADGLVNAADAQFVEQRLTASPAPLVIPEPATLALLLFGAFGALRRKR